LTTSLNNLIERYVRAWNENDVQRRARALAEIYAEDAILVMQSAVFEGIEAVVAHIAGVFDEFLAHGRFVFRSGGFNGHHDCVLFRWEMAESADGTLADAGMNTFVLDEDGRIRWDYQFALGTDSSIGSMAARAS
jgi:ketosteroid isomerase-like protein